MSSGRSSTSRSRRTQSTKATTVNTGSRKSSAYDDNFEQHLIDNDIYPEGHEYPENRATPQPSDLDQIHQALLVTRASLSPSRFPESAFRDFQKKNKTKSEGTVMRNVIPIIAGNTDIPNEGNLHFTNLTSMTDETTVKAVPDYFDGARMGDIHRQQIHHTHKAYESSGGTKFFLEAKAPKGGTDVALKQACYDGAYGARAMHALQGYRETEPVYDGNAYTFSSTYHAGTLKMYANHVTAPTTEREDPEYHMTQLRTFGMTDTRDTFIQGAAAFRNARDLAEQHRDGFIQAANSRAP
ncbi:hypothetical protein ACHAPT_012606 [Fusarium lateritium]